MTSLAINNFYPVSWLYSAITGSFCVIYVVLSIIYEFLEGCAIGPTNYFKKIENAFQILRNVVFFVAVGHVIYITIVNWLVLDVDLAYEASIVRIFGGVRILDLNSLNWSPKHYLTPFI